MHVQMVTQMVTFVPWIRVLFISRIYGHLFLRRRSVVRVIYQWGSVYFRIPRADSGLWVSAQRWSDDDDDVSFFRLFRNPRVRFVIVHSSDGYDQIRDRFQCRESDDLEDGNALHLFISIITFCIYLHLTHVYPYAGTFLIEILVERLLAQI